MRSRQREDGTTGDPGEPLVGGGLGRRLLVWLLVFSLVPLFVTNAVGYARSEVLIEQLVERYVDAVARVEAQHIRSQLDRYALDLQAIAAGNEFLAAGAVRLGGGAAGRMGEMADADAVERHLESKWRELVVFDALYLQRPDGRLIASSGIASPAVMASISAPGETGRLVRVADDTAGGLPRFVLSVPVLSVGGDAVAFLGGVVGEIGLAGLLEIPPHLAGSIESFIVDEAGRPIFVSHRHGPLNWGERLATPLLDGPVGAFATYRDRNGVEVIGTSVAIEALPWRFIAEVPVADALGPLHMLRSLSTVLGTAFAVLLVVGAWFVAGGVVAPVRDLVTATRRVGAGELAVQVPANRKDEIGQLAHAFNNMTQELARSAARIQELHQREIERAQQLATVGELASGIAHEIKNPLVGISNGLDLVHRRVGDDAKLAPITDEMKRQLARMEMAVRDLLAFARPAEPALDDADANAILERAARLVQPAAERAGVAVELRPAPSLPTLRVDRELMHQALVNLLMNAVQATPAGGSVIASTEGGADGVAFRITDTGRGIAADQLAQIFKPFFTTRHSGTGLGLPITRDIIERHGGRLAVQSEPGKGSTFTFELPVTAAQAGTSEGAPHRG